MSILRPLCNQHREITYLESLLLYLTQECKSIFQSLIRCDYLLESHQVKAVRAQNKALIKNYMLRTTSQATPLQLQWKLWNALDKMRRYGGLSDGSGSQAAEEFVRYIEIDEKFARMQFIQHSIK